MPRHYWTVARIVVLGAAALGSFVVAAFAWFVVISWHELTEAIGPANLLVVLAVVAAAVVSWAVVAVRYAAHPARRLSRAGRAGLAGVTVASVLTGVVALPSIRARLESDKCHRVAAADHESQLRCREWLETRREWWTLGLSHTDRNR